MNERIFRQLFWFCAVVVFIIGVAMTMQSLRQFNEASLRLTRNLQDLDKLRSMERELNHYQAARQAFERLADKSPVSLTALMQDILPGYRASEIRKFSRECVPGWIVRQVEIDFSEVSLEKALEFICKAEMPTLRAGDRPLRLRQGYVGQVDTAQGRPLDIARDRQRPPWRLVKCVIRASSGATGMGQVTLLMEALEEKGLR